MNNVASDLVENLTFDELQIGQGARLVRTLSAQDIAAFAAVSGDSNPAHLDSGDGTAPLMHEVVGHGMWSGALVSALLGTQFPGAGTRYLDQSLHFIVPVRVGDTLTVSVTVTAKDAARGAVELACELINQKGERVASGIARVLAPTQKIRLPRSSRPEIHLFDPQARFNALLALGRALPAVRCAVVHPCDEASLTGAVDAARLGLLEPVLIGPEARLRAVAEACGLDLGGLDLIAMPHSHAAAEHAAELAASGAVASLMKGSLHTDELVRAVLARKELRTGRRVSHVFRFDVPLYSKPLLITDAALNIRPTLDEKRDIVQNAIDFARILGVDRPHVALLSAVETVNANIPSTLDAAALCKMADRGQISGGVLDGPLAFDNAISAEAARIKGIASPVAGQADILAVPDLESGNMLAKQLEYLAGATGAGIVLGARVPIALTSRADGPMARASSALLVQLVAQAAAR
ncbi:bifunctional enoyl-CoA hydratase/phosphate acetyltransferase [Roseateles sp.]|uniref:bifunctional enoyl-CoA hydratase/phosphate acetyltransferase n=1 Tax=Roseateles sp. TaxID=1971397 RepID=UPI003D0CA9D3